MGAAADHQRGFDLVVDDQLTTAADGIRVHLLPLRVEHGLARAERPRPEAAHRVDAAGEVALEERQLVVDDALEARWTMGAPASAFVPPDRNRPSNFAVV